MLFARLITRVARQSPRMAQIAAAPRAQHDIRWSDSPSTSPRAKAFDACVLHLKEEYPHSKDPRQIIADFKAAINMTPQEIEDFLNSEESWQAASIGDEADRQGRHMARRVIELLSKDDGTGEMYYEGDYLHMHQVSAYINCHKQQLQTMAASEDELKSALLSSPERYHLMNFGYDPLKAFTRGRAA